VQQRSLSWLKLSSSKCSQFFLNTLYDHVFFFAKLILMERRRPPKVIFHLDMVHNLPTKLPQKSWTKNHFLPSSRTLQTHMNATNWCLQQYWVKCCFINQHITILCIGLSTGLKTSDEERADLLHWTKGDGRYFTLYSTRHMRYKH
jgi:hypothetical protein